MLTPDQITAYKSAVPPATENESMAKHTSFRIGGPARLYVVAHSSDELIRAASAARASDLPFFIYGGGSNLLVSDDGFQGVVIQAANRGIKNQDSGIMLAEAGCITALAARKSVDARLAGFEWAIGVPGTIGGALYGNAGCYGGEMKDVVASVDAYRLSDGRRVRLSNADCRFAYRESFFKHEPHVILGCELALRSSADPSVGKARMDEIMRLRKEKQPLEQSSCGCAFKNFEFGDESALEILRRQVEVPQDMLKNKRLSAGWLIDQAGLAGQRIGAVEVSPKHANFMVTTGQARAQDVIALISLIKRKVRDEFGIELQEEVQYLGFEV